MNLAMAVVCRPPVLLLDEPSCGLDPLARLAIAKVIQRLSSPLRSPFSHSPLSLDSERASRLSSREGEGREEDEYEGGDVGQETIIPSAAVWTREQEKETGYSSVPLRIGEATRPGPTRRSATQATVTAEGADPCSASCIVISSHAMEEVEALASRVLVLENGRLLCIGTPQQITVNSQKHQAGGLLTIFRVKLSCVIWTHANTTLGTSAMRCYFVCQRTWPPRHLVVRTDADNCTPVCPYIYTRGAVEASVYVYLWGESAHQDRGLSFLRLVVVEYRQPKVPGDSCNAYGPHLLFKSSVMGIAFCLCLARVQDWFSPGLLLTVHLPVPSLATFPEPVPLFSSASSSEGQAPASDLSFPLSTPAVLGCPTWGRCPSPSTDRISPRVRPEDAAAFTLASPVFPSSSLSTSSGPEGRLKTCVASVETRDSSSPAVPGDEPQKRARVSSGIREMLARLPRGGWMPATLLLHICELFDSTRSASSAFQ